MAFQTVYSKDIFHGLPDFSNSNNFRSTAIVVGANGIPGAYISRVLASSPERWETVYALSRQLPQSPHGVNVKPIQVDLLQSPESIASVLKESIKKV